MTAEQQLAMFDDGVATAAVALVETIGEGRAWRPPVEDVHVDEAYL